MNQKGFGWVRAILFFEKRTIGRKILSPAEVVEHPEKYLGKEITVEGYYLSYVISTGNGSHVIVPFLPESWQDLTELEMKALALDLPKNIQVFSRGR